MGNRLEKQKKMFEFVNEHVVFLLELQALKVVCTYLLGVGSQCLLFQC